MKKSLLLATVLLSLASCGRAKPQEVAATATVVEIADMPPMKWPADLLVLDTLAIVHDLHAADMFYHIVDLKSGRFLRSFGQRGNGPLELINPVRLVYKDGTLYTIDTSKSAVVKYLLSSLLNDTLRTEYKLVTLPEKAIASDLAIDSEGGLYLYNITGSPKIWHVNTAGEVVEKLFDLPLDAAGDTQYDMFAAALWQSVMGYDAQNNMLAVATRLGDVLEIYDMSTKKLVNRVVGLGGEPEIVERGNSRSLGRISGYQAVFVAPKHIYAIFDGREMSPENTENGGKIIRVFDLHGKLLRNLNLDEPAGSLFVTSDENRIYLLDPNSETPIRELGIRS